MEFLDELEKLATNVSRDISGDIHSNEPTQQAIQKWQHLFDFSEYDASAAIQDHRSNISRISVSDEHWAAIQTQQESQGYDREAYEYELGRDFLNGRNPKPKSSAQITTTKPSPARARAIYIIKLEGPLDTPEEIQEAAGLNERPLTIQGESEEDKALANFCRINGAAKLAITNWLSAQNISFRPMFTRCHQKALKDFHEDSLFPTLGIESTLPQFRAQDYGTRWLPEQIQYPVWYFFYGTLAQPETLSRQIRRECKVGRELREAYVVGGKLGTWGGKYEALADDFSLGGKSVKGMACEIMSMKEEDALLVYETDNYEVVRCEIIMGEERVRGCTFRFIGDSYDS